MQRWTRRWAQAQGIFRSAMLVALVMALALPVGFIRAADDVASAAQTQLPTGYRVTYSQIVDLGGDGQMQAIIKAESASAVAATLTAQIVGVLVQKGDAWQLVSQTQPFPDSGTIADIYAYPKNSQHPGFVITNAHLCGANCNAGTYALMRYDNGNLMPTLSGVNDRGNLSADPDTAAVTLTGPRIRLRGCPLLRAVPLRAHLDMAGECSSAE